VSLSIQKFAAEGLPTHLQGNAARTVAFGNELLATVPGLRFTSGHRSAARNRAVGGVANSKHVKALAIDFVSTDGRYPPSLLDRVRAIANAHGYETLLHDAGSGLHLHFEYEGEQQGSLTKAATATKAVFGLGSLNSLQWGLIGAGLLFIAFAVSDS
jgi:hypothetical protein